MNQYAALITAAQELLKEAFDMERRDALNRDPFNSAMEAIEEGDKERAKASVKQLLDE